MNYWNQVRESSHDYGIKIQVLHEMLIARQELQFGDNAKY
jgi:hypothetical protein